MPGQVNEKNKGHISVSQLKSKTGPEISISLITWMYYKTAYVYMASSIVVMVKVCGTGLQKKRTA